MSKRRPASGEKALPLPHRRNVRPNRPRADSFPIVGVGASAGGLEALERLLKHLPADTGMAFVVVQHLDPTHESRLAEILSRGTSMPVTEVQDKTRISPNHVYIIPPNANMFLEDGLLRLEARKDPKARYLPIDFLFRSLASTRKSKAIGVILSGTGSDGASGTKAIKLEGGITFAQDSASAKYFDMPQNSIRTGAVDFVLPPEQIADHLTRIGRHPYLKLSEIEEEAERTLAHEREDPRNRLLALLSESHGVDFSAYKPSTINRRIKRRMALQGMDHLNDYLRYVRDNPEELQRLYQDMFIAVTSFFREPKSFEALKKIVFPRIMKERSADSPIRIWVPGCSTGEEVYSIAISLLEYLKDRANRIPIQIFGTDINEEAIAKAREGKYPAEIAPDVGKKRLQRFFLETDNGYQVSKPVRDFCIFARHDLTNNPPFSRLDLVSCRNVLIYLGTPLQQKLIPLFHYALKPTGFLMMGTAETVGEFAELFTLVDRRHKIYAKKPGAILPPRWIFSARHPAEAVGADSVKKSAADRTRLEPYKDAADLIILNQYAPASVLVDENMEILHFRGHTSPYLEPAPGAPSLNLFKMAREGLLVGLQSAMKSARKKNLQARAEGLRIDFDGREKIVNIQVVPVKSPETKERTFLVLFEDITEKVPASEKQAPKRGRLAEAEKTQRVVQLKQELATTKAYLQSVIEDQETSNEELRSLNEEILATNEELQSATEELETSNEELQSANEELTTLNEELHHRNALLSQAHNDILNLLSNMNMSIVFLDQELRIRRMTPTAERILHTVSRDIGRPLRDVPLNIEIPDLEQLLLDAMNTGKVVTREIQDRQGRWLFLQTRPYITADNKIEGAVFTLTDIQELSNKTRELAAANQRLQQELTMRQQIESDLLRTQQRLSHLISATPTVIYTARLIGDFEATFVSDNVRNVLGYEAEDFKTPGFFTSRIHPDDRERFMTGMRSLLETDTYVHEYRFQTKDGNWRWGLDSGRVTIRDSQRNPIECVGSWVDITERKQLEEKAQEAAILHERNRVARDVHDSLAQGLTGIVLQLEGVDEALTRDPQEAQKRIARVRSLARSSLEEVRRALSFLRSHVLDEADLAKALARMINDLKQDASARIELCVRGTSQPLSLEVRENLLRITQEALGNAIRHGKATKIQVEYTYAPGTLDIRIEDNGRGLSELKSTDHRGLGLSVMRERATEIGAHFNLRSRTGRGTCVELRVPIPPSIPEKLAR